ncbi:MAG: N-6 DNA methylase [Opitutales bacterium]|nr:N-6 DNA methylase [Opitutales bacterium]
MMDDIERLEADLWSAADNLRSNGNVPSNEYFLPVLGIIFLRHATNRYHLALQDIEAAQAAGKMPKRPLVKADFIKRRALMLPEEARFETLLDLPEGKDLAKALESAMDAVERDFPPLLGQLPKEYQKLDNDLLEHLMRVFDSEMLRTATGDIFGRIYEYFLMKFSMVGAHDNGEFFTPPSIVQAIVNVIEPDHGCVFDPACGSGGMFVQSSHFIEAKGEDTSHKVTFYGQEKTGTTVRLAKMNLAVHGLEGEISEANSYYQDEHELVEKCDFVMANPPFNVDAIDAEKIKTDPRLPFGLPGVNKAKKVSNGNYVWISYFHAYLKPAPSTGSGRGGRAGFVMSSQASSAGNQEAEVRRKLVETGDVDVMISIRSNFFYTRTVPCELWFIDRGKPDQPSPPAPLPEVEGSQDSHAGCGTHYRGGFDFAGLKEKAREFRKKQTSAEALLWELLRNRQLSGAKFRRQHQFGDYILDFYCDEAKLVVECDGEVHETKDRQAKDAKRDAYLQSQGLKVLRFKNQQVLADTESVLEGIAHDLSLPSPSGKGAGGAPTAWSGSEGNRLPSPLGRGAGGEGKFCASTALNHRGNVLMIDARNIFRKVTRKIYDFTPEHLKNLNSIVWLYRGQNSRFLKLVQDYFGAVCEHAETVPDSLQGFTAAFVKAMEPLKAYAAAVHKVKGLDETKVMALEAALAETLEAEKAFEIDEKATLAAVKAWRSKFGDNIPADNASQHTARTALDPVAARIKGLGKQVDLLSKLLARVAQACRELAAGDDAPDGFERNTTNKLIKAVDEAKQTASEALKQTTYFHRQISWLQERFPEAKFCAVAGLCKAVTRAEIEAADWSLTPGRYVGVAPAEEDEDFDFEQTIRDIHTELADLNEEAAALAGKIQKNFEGLAV